MSKVLFVDDGSVDVDELQEILPEVPVITYRAGSLKPEFVDVDTPVNVIKKEPPDLDGLCAPEGMCTDKALPVYTPEEIREAIKQTFLNNVKKKWNIESQSYTYILLLDSESIDFFTACVIRVVQKLAETKTESGADPSGDN